MAFPRPIHLGLALSAAALLTACTTLVRGPDLGELYNRAAASHGPDRNPVIVIPGILGSKLVQQDGGRLVWGAFSGSYANPSRADGARLIAIPMQEGRPLNELRDDVVSAGSLDRLRIRLFGLPIGLSAYANILGALGVGGFQDQQLSEAGAIDYPEDHFTCFQFDYDWRRDIGETARELHAFVEAKRAFVEAENQRRYGRSGAPVKFDVVAHSMGGLVLRYYLRYGSAQLEPGALQADVPWSGAEFIERAVLIGPPNGGSIETVSQLVYGAKFAFFLPRYEPAILGSMPAIYQLLPRERHGALLGEQAEVLDPFDAELWERRGWGLADPEQDRVLKKLLPAVRDGEQRRRIALDHQRKCLERARLVTQALDRPSSPPPGVDLYLIAGDAVATDARMQSSGKGRVFVTDTAPGDGTVLRRSALLDERLGESWSPTLRSPIDWTQVLFLSTDHLDLTKDPAFTDNVLYLLLEDPRQD